VDTYLRFAEATNRLDLYERGGKDLFDALGDSTERVSSGKVSGAIKGVKDAITGGDDEEDEEERPRPAKKAPSPQRAGNG
jgi:gas vesicle structural protein